MNRSARAAFFLDLFPHLLCFSSVASGIRPCHSPLSRCSAQHRTELLELSSIHNQGWEQLLRGYLRVLCGVLFLCYVWNFS